MKAYIPLAISLAAAFAVPPAAAETCQWKDAAGRTVVSDSPPQGRVKDLKCVGGAGFSATTPAAPATADAAGPKTTAEKDADFKKRQSEAKEKADKDAKEQAAASQRKENCDRARRQLAALEGGQRMATYDDKGEKVVLDDAARQQEIERTRQYVGEACK